MSEKRISIEEQCTPIGGDTHYLPTNLSVPRSEIEEVVLEVMAGDAGQEIIEGAAWNVLEELGCQMNLATDVRANAIGSWVVAIARTSREGLRRKWESWGRLRPMRERAQAIEPSDPTRGYCVAPEAFVADVQQLADQLAKVPAMTLFNWGLDPLIAKVRAHLEKR